jgi:hypothetical protein
MYKDMSNYSHALRTVIDVGFDKRQLRLAEAADVPQSLISRHLTGEFRPDLETLEKLSAVLPPDLRAKLVIAHLNDETPPSARYDIVISATTTSSACELHEGSPPPNIFDRLDRKTQNAIKALIESAIDNPAARDVLQSTALLIGAKL